MPFSVQDHSFCFLIRELGMAEGITAGVLLAGLAVIRRLRLSKPHLAKFENGF